MNYLKLTLLVLLFFCSINSYCQFDVAPPPPPPSKKSAKVQLPKNIKFMSFSDDVGKDYENRIKFELVKLFGEEKQAVDFYLTDHPHGSFSKDDGERKKVKSEYEVFIENKMTENDNKVIIHLHYEGINYDQKTCKVSFGKNIDTAEVAKLEELNICARIEGVRFK